MKSRALSVNESEINNPLDRIAEIAIMIENVARQSEKIERANVSAILTMIDDLRMAHNIESDTQQK